MKFLKLISTPLVAAGLALAVTASPVSAKTYRFATNVSADGNAGLQIQQFVDAVKDRTEGRVEFELFINGQLGDQLQYFQQIQRGVVDAGLVNSAALENIIPAFGVVNLPYVFRTSEEYGSVMTDDRVREALFNAAEKHKFWPLGFLSSGFRSIYTTMPLESFEDLKGKKLRTMSSPTYIEMLKLFGAVPTPLPFGEVYSGMQQGIVDGAEGGLAGLYSAKFGEVAKYALETNQTRLSDFIVTSIRFKESLSEEDHQAVVEEFEKISLASIVFADENEASDLQKAVDEMGVTVIKMDTAPFIEAVSPMYEAALNDADKKELIETIFEIENREF
ncbi:TRAP transporter substrate-binding protein DctP [Granulosicoccus antarcticus]|uniref:Solute-binding protein n=1 Tax=Granulosicoccus antarcticus IMCC3135 TaxID=1192854 RepID=A0A2Z2NTJ0_9GAMM|nr:TRAP transporter substrate-binding protein DctP [Granulosicoccus antarcticus]ASJ73835.1 Solute-binding protein [Granulosicoccus antarcticus IMCC3135]